MRQKIKRVLTTPLVLLVALYIFFFEWLWAWLRVLIERFSALPIVVHFDTWAKQRRPWFLAAFVVSINGLSTLSKITIAPWLWSAYDAIIFWYYTLFMFVYDTLTNAMSARILFTERDRLMSIWWFAWIHTSMNRLLAYLHAYVRSLEAWQQARHYIRTVRTWCSAGRGGLIITRLRAIYRRAQRKPTQ